MINAPTPLTIAAARLASFRLLIGGLWHRFTSGQAVAIMPCQARE